MRKIIANRAWKRRELELDQKLNSCNRRARRAVKHKMAWLAAHRAVLR